MKSIRAQYETFGAEGYYQSQGNAYTNPHEQEVIALVQRNLHMMPVKNGVLDLGGGGGEVTKSLLAINNDFAITGCDPFTYLLYEQQTGRKCLRHSFLDIIKGADIEGPYGVVISSFAMHLCPERDLYALCAQLFRVADMILVVTPHKRPALETIPGIELVWEDCERTPKEKRVIMKAYLPTATHF